MTKPLPTAEILDRFILELDVSGTPTGRLLHRVNRFHKNQYGGVKQNVWANTYADTTISKGSNRYRQTSWRRDGKSKYLSSHCIVYFLATGIDPEAFDVDHKDNTLLDSDGAKVNAPDNLQLLNRRNHTIKDMRCGKCGFIGVTTHDKSFRASLRLCGKFTHSKCVSSPREAATLYDELVLKHYGPDATTNASLGLL